MSEVAMLCSPLQATFAIVLALNVASFASAQTKLTPSKPAVARPKDSPDEQQLRQSIVKFVELYNAHKAGDIAALFAADARVVFRDGTEVNGREEITQSFETAFDAGPKSAIRVVVDSLRFLTADVAVEEGYT